MLVDPDGDDVATRQGDAEGDERERQGEDADEHGRLLCLYRMLDTRRMTARGTCVKDLSQVPAAGHGRIEG
ncbi:hypothetical protein PDTK01_25460 [Phycicoccus sp. DTK01]|nr:hypothetical protein PDTK01_25460 [Phycicoccus sp. DTK01]